MKTIVMVVSLALVTGASVACFGLFSDGDKTADQSCQELSGKEKADCEQSRGAKPR